MPTTRIDEIATDIYRICTSIPPDPAMPSGFTFSQFLIVDDEPVLFHTGMRRLFPDVRAAVAPSTEADIVGPSEQLRAMFDYFSNPVRAAATVERLASHEPALLAPMHGSAYRGDCVAALHALASCLKGAA